MRSLFTTTCLVAVLGLAGSRAWERWGPAPQAPVAASAEVAQWDARTCGPAAVATLLNVCGRPWTRAGIERECRVGPKGSSMFDLRETLRRHGLKADAWHATEASGLTRAPRPFIAHLAEGHFVVATTLSDDTFGIFDPTFGRRYRWTAGELYRKSGGWFLATSGQAVADANGNTGEDLGTQTLPELRGATGPTEGPR